MLQSNILLYRKQQQQQQESSGSREARKQKFEIPEAAPIYSIKLDSKAQQSNASSLSAALKSGKKKTQVPRASLEKYLRTILKACSQTCQL